MPESLKTFLNYIFDGSLGVRMFFVISGFIITVLLFGEIKTKGRIDFVKFYWRRCLRIFPPFYFYVLVLFLLKEMGYVVIENRDIVFAMLYLQNFRFYESNWLLSHSWSLAVEEQFYLIYPWLLYRFRLKAFTFLNLVLIVLLGAFMRSVNYKFPGYANYVLAPFFMQFDFLFMGCFLGYAYAHHYEKLSQWVSLVKPHWILFMVGIGYFFTLMEFHPVYDIFFVPTTGIVIGLVTSMILIYFIFNPGNLFGRILNTTFFDFFGRLSYSWYIWQQLFLSSNFLLSPKIKWIGLYPQNLFLSFFAALFSFFVVEKPFLKIKEKFSI